jgi:hypothetical protein
MASKHLKPTNDLYTLWSGQIDTADMSNIGDAQAWFVAALAPRQRPG